MNSLAGAANLRGPQEPEEPQGPKSVQGPQRHTVTLGSTSYSYSIAQLSYVLNQLITMYPKPNYWTAYTPNLNQILTQGYPKQLYTSPQGTDAGMLVLRGSSWAGDYGAIPLSDISTLLLGFGSVYNPDIKYLPAPFPIPNDCDTNKILAIQSYLPLNSVANILTGTETIMSGLVIKNEFGLLVLAGDGGSNPIFIPDSQIDAIFTNTLPPGMTEMPVDEKQLRKLQRLQKKVKLGIKSIKLKK